MALFNMLNGLVYNIFTGTEYVLSSLDAQIRYWFGVDDVPKSAVGRLCDVVGNAVLDLLRLPRDYFDWVRSWWEYRCNLGSLVLCISVSAVSLSLFYSKKFPQDKHNLKEIRLYSVGEVLSETWPVAPGEEGHLLYRFTDSNLSDSVGDLSLPDVKVVNRGTDTGLDKRNWRIY